MEYAFKDYFTQQEIDNAWKGITPALDRITWEANVNRSWHHYGLLEWIYKRTGRPIVENLDLKTLLDCCKIHLEGCNLFSFDNCDFQEKWYGKDAIKTKFLTYGICAACFASIKASESPDLCARCYRKKLNNWRPTI